MLRRGEFEAEVMVVSGEEGVVRGREKDGGTGDPLGCCC